MDQEQDDPKVNIILRRGPEAYDGTQLSGNPSQPLAIGKGPGTAHFMYRPAGRMDDEYRELARFDYVDLTGP